MKNEKHSAVAEEHQFQSVRLELEEAVSNVIALCDLLTHEVVHSLENSDWPLAGAKTFGIMQLVESNCRRLQAVQQKV